MQTDVLGNKQPQPMVVYFSRKTIDCQIPENILAEVMETFTTFRVDTLSDGTVVVRVPESEKKLAKQLRDDVFTLLVAKRKENAVLVGKLARRYGF